MAENGKKDTEHVNIPPGAPFAVVWEDPETGQVRMQHNMQRRRDLYGLLDMGKEIETVSATIQAIQSRAQQAQKQGGLVRPPPGLRLD